MVSEKEDIFPTWDDFAKCISGFGQGFNKYLKCMHLCCKELREKISYIAGTMVIDFKDWWCISVFLSYLVKSEPDFWNLY